MMKTTRLIPALCLLLGISALAQVHADDLHLSTAFERDPRLVIAMSDAPAAIPAAATAAPSGWSVQPTLSPDGRNVGMRAAYTYTGSSFKEVLWGLSRPLHLYNRNPASSKRQWLPFYLSPLKAGGALSPLNPRAWRDNPQLTAGALLADAAITAAAIAASQSSSKRSKGNTEYLRDEQGNIVYTTDPVTGEQTPVVIYDGGDDTTSIYDNNSGSFDGPTTITGGGTSVDTSTTNSDDSSEGGTVVPSDGGGTTGGGGTIPSTTDESTGSEGGGSSGSDGSSSVGDQTGESGSTNEGNMW